MRAVLSSELGIKLWTRLADSRTFVNTLRWPIRPEIGGDAVTWDGGEIVTWDGDGCATISFEALLTIMLNEEDRIGMVLYPDMSRDQYTENDTFVWGAPLHPAEFGALSILSNQGLKAEHPRWVIHDNHGVVLRKEHHTDDDCLMTAAWMRQFGDFDGRIYACAESDNQTTSMVINRAMAAPRELVALLSDPK